MSTIFGALFKIMHWPFAKILLIVGITGLALSFGYNTLWPENKDSDEDVLD